MINIQKNSYFLSKHHEIKNIKTGIKTKIKIKINKITIKVTHFKLDKSRDGGDV